MQTFDDNELADFLRLVDDHLAAPTRVILVGGAVISLSYGSKYATRDIDYFGRSDEFARAAAEAARVSTNPIPVQHAAVADPPYNFEDRLEPIPIPGLSRLELVRPDQHDLALMKVVRGQQPDLDALADVHRISPFDLDTLLSRWPEMRQAIGRLERIRNNLLLLISILFGDEAAEEADSKLEHY